jgi:hypothetical protein
MSMSPAEFAVALSGPSRTRKVVVDIKEVDDMALTVIRVAQHPEGETNDQLSERLGMIALYVEAFATVVTSRLDTAIHNEFAKPESERRWENMVANDDCTLVPMPPKTK